MFSVVCVLHSGNGHFSPALCSNATSAVMALFHSVSAGSPEFIPNLAILRADPVTGTRFLFSTAVANSNHAVSTATLFAHPSSDGAPSADSTADNSVLRAFVARDPSIIAQSIFDGTRTAMPSASMEESTHCTDPWACLAGALLTGLCFLNKHELIGVGPGADGSAATTSSSSWAGLMSEMVHDRGDEGVTGTTWMTTRGCVLIFSDCTARGALSFTAETSLAVAAVMLAKCGLTVSCFGDSVRPGEENHATETRTGARRNASHAHSSSHHAIHTRATPTRKRGAQLAHAMYDTGEKAETEAETDTNAGSIVYLDDVYGAGQARLRALAASLHGICAPVFTLDMLSTLLDVADAVDDAAASSSVRRTRGEHVAEQYVVRPTMLPMVPTSSINSKHTHQDKHEDSSSRTAFVGNERDDDHSTGREHSLDDDHTRRPHQQGGYAGAHRAGEVGLHDTRAEERPHDDADSAENEGLGWLCPRCMAVVRRDRSDAGATAEDLEAGNEQEGGTSVHKTCLYCLI